MTSSETLDRVWQQIECLYQTGGELLEVQRTTVLKIQRSDEELSDTDRQLPDASQLLDQLSQLRERLNQQSKQVQQDATETTQEASNYLKELSIERLNVIEPDGTLRLVLCNTKHSPGHFMDGEQFGEPDGKRPAGIYFFNNEGNECGGLAHGGERNEDGSYYAGGALTFDQYRQDQVIFIQHEDTNGRRSASLNIVDRPEMPINEWAKEFQRLSDLPEGPEKEAALKRLEVEHPHARRVFVGKENNLALVCLHDGQGRIRIRLSVEPEGTARLEFFDESGETVAHFPQN
ncbi:MAG: hypothetical protein OXG87_13235 [Gemmatimonadetes bacterium]|nr:hypothetical protein [Gemmatimonadota bacterium]